MRSQFLGDPNINILKHNILCQSQNSDTKNTNVNIKFSAQYVMLE